MTIYEIQLGVRRLLDKVQSQQISEFTDSEIDFFINMSYDKLVNELIYYYDSTSYVLSALSEISTYKILDVEDRTEETISTFPIPEDFYNVLGIKDDVIKYKPVKAVNLFELSKDPFNKPNKFLSWYSVHNNKIYVYSIKETAPEKINLFYVKNIPKLKKGVTYTEENRKTLEYFAPKILQTKIMEGASYIIKNLVLNLNLQPQENNKEQ